MKLEPIKSIFGKKTVIWGAGLALVLGGSVGMRSLVGSVNHGHAHVKGATIKSEASITFLALSLTRADGVSRADGDPKA